MKTLSDIGNVKGKRILIRVDFNVPVSDGKVLDDFRIQKSLPTIYQLKEKGAEIVLISHFESKENVDFKVVADYVSSILPIEYCDSFEKERIDEMLEESSSKVILLQNLRNHPGEKNNSKDFAEFLASLADIYVNEAFSVSHREHASIVGVPKLIDGFIGLTFESEVKALSEAEKPEGESLFILGGAKMDTKLPLIAKFSNVYTNIVIGGALANTIYKSKGLEIGKSLSDDGDFRLPEKNNGEYILPEDVVVENNNESQNKRVNEVLEDDVICDAGKESVERIISYIKKSDTILWNGPFGNYEKGYKDATLAIAKAMSECNAKTILGGGDTLASIEELGLMDKFTHVSTGGGAMLDFLSNGTLVGIEALS